MDGIIEQTILEFNKQQDVKTSIAVFKLFDPGDDISISLIQRKCKVGYNTAYRTFCHLMYDGRIKQVDNRIYKFITS